MAVANDSAMYLPAAGQGVDARAGLEKEGRGERVATDAELAHAVVEVKSLGRGAALGVAPQEGVALEDVGPRDLTEDEAGVVEVGHGGEGGAGEEGGGDGGITDEAGAEKVRMDLQETGLGGAGFDEGDTITGGGDWGSAVGLVTQRR